MDIKQELWQLYEEYEPELATYGWASEDDRWTELVFCLLHQCSEQEPETVRAAVLALHSLSLTEVERLADLDDVGHENRIVFAYVLKQYGFSDVDIELAAGLLGHVAKVVEDRCGGKVQRYLRRHGEAMRDELARSFGGTALPESRLAYAISHWLQNALSLPISLQNAAVLKFCEDKGVSPESLWQAADELDINLALVDDLLEMDLTLREGAAGDEEWAGKEGQ